MSKSPATGESTASRFVVKYRKLFTGIAIGACVYALLGFFVAPWFVKKTAIEAVSTNLNANLTLHKLAINPFVLSLRIDQLQLEESAGQPVASVDEIFINFQLSSLFRWAWTFNEFHISGPELFLERDVSGELNLARLTPEKAEAPPPPADDSGTSQPRLLILDFAIRDSVVTWSDQVPIDPVETVFGPVNIQIKELNTLPQREGRQEVVITTETQGTLSWAGTLQLNPINSSGRATITGSHFPLTSAYMRHETGLDIVEGTADAGLNYSITTAADGSLEVAVDDFDLTFADVLVRTFHGNTAAGVDESDLFSLPRIALAGGAMRWPERTISIESFIVTDPVVDLTRKSDGKLDLGPANDSSESAANTGNLQGEDVNSADAAPWRFSLQQLGVERLSLSLIDESVAPAAEVGIESLDLKIRDISNDPGANFPTELMLVPRTGGSISLSGNLAVLPEPILDFELNIENLALAGAHPYLQPLADVNLDSGALNLAAQLRSDSVDRLLLTGDLNIADFLITETDEGSRLGSWARMDIKNFIFSEEKRSFEASELLFDKPYGDILIAADGSVNLGRVRKSASAAEDEEAEVTKTNDSADSAFAVVIGRILIEDASADFADQSLPLPFEAQIANLNGNMTTISTTSSEPSTVEMEGTVDEFGFVRISGSTTPLETKRNTDLKITFQNVAIPKFSAYTIPFAGREIASGKLDLDLGYKVTQSELTGENKIVLRDLELGDKVPHPGAMSLPLGLAVALLKDPDGKIDIDLPIRGNVDDPEFRYGGVVLKALGTLIVKIVASPFALLGNLLGVEASELEYVSFLPGRADLTPPELERAGQLAEALTLRPVLVLELRGAISREQDGLAMRQAKLDSLVESRLPEANAGDAMYAEQRLSALEALYTETTTLADPTAEMAALRAKFTAPAADENSEKASPQFDELAYASELHRLLVAVQTVDDTELATLANERAENIRDAISAAGPELTGRIIVASPQAVESDDGESVAMKITLRAATDDDPDTENGEQ